MRKARALLLAAGLLAGAAMASTFPLIIPSSREAIDLDVPGALEALQQQFPARYKQVMEAVERAQKLPPLDERASIRSLGLDFATPRAQGFLLTYPAKRHITVVAEGVQYKISAYFTEDPARIHKAR